MGTAIVLGATGLVGRQLVKMLLGDKRFDKVKVFVRRNTGVTHPKLESYVVNFDTPAPWQHLITGDVLFSTLGTTLRKAGSQSAQYKVDYTYQYQAAKIAAENGIKTYVLVSAAFSSPDAGVFYSRIKGELERDVTKLGFKSIHIIRPGVLSGRREKTRWGEKIGAAGSRLFSYLPGMRKYRPVKDVEVARAMINASLSAKNGLHSYTLDEVFDLAKK
jgi:uncharacterized protein YbjT (DUF2867 family)